MTTCLNHPEVTTQRRCAICDEYYCSACLEAYDEVGPVCTACETEIQEVSGPALEAELPAIRARVQQTLPAPRPWWGWELLFFCALLLPSALATHYFYQMFRFHQALAILSREPVLPGIVTAQLTELSAALEAHWAAHGSFPDTLQELVDAGTVPEDQIRDPYSWEEDGIVYQVAGSTYRLCSRGSDRTDSMGQPMDRFAGTGDICTGP